MLAFLKVSEKFLSNRGKALILFDEIEDIFPERFDPIRPSSSRRYASAGKAWINQVLENNVVPVIWVTNDIRQMDPAYLRRFTYHLEFRTPPQSVRRQIAERYLGQSGLGVAFFHRLAADTRLTPALMENTARFLQLSGDLPAEQAEQLADRIIRQSHAAMGETSCTEVKALPTTYSIDYVNIDSRHDIGQIISALRHRPTGSLCFYGLPGTGKTALARHMAEAVNRPLLVKRASDLLSKWLGEFEQNIAAMFDEARQERAVLLLDEAELLAEPRECRAALGSQSGQ